MRSYLAFAAIVLVGLALGKAPAYACMAMAPLELADIKYADVVVLGRISNYEIVDGEPGQLGDYARFTVSVDDVLFGQPPQQLTAVWDNSTYAEPESMPSGSFLIALRDPRSQTPPLRGPSATVLPNPEPTLLTVLQAPCSDAFIFSSTSDEARTILKTLRP